MKSSKPLVVSIMGPTASGKTAAALAIAKSIPCEIISVDSALIYRGMDIGTAKPSDEERSQVPHHLIDILDPSLSYSVKQFRDDALRLIADIQARSKLPLLVGGTMLYFKALRDGLDDLPSADLALRSQLDMEITRHGTAALHARLRELDPITAERLNPNDTQRVQRAMEIILLSGQPMSSQLDKADKPELPFELMSLALEPSDRKVLHERIAQRFDVMLSAKLGLIEETAALKQREMGIAATRQLAKRQLTWLRSMPDRQVIDCLSSNPTEQILSLVTARLG